MAAVITGTSLRESRSATKAIRRMLVSRSSFEKPSPLERFSRTMSPSRISSFEPRSRRWPSSSLEMVVLPAPESPVNQRVKPFSPAIGTSILLVSVDEYVSDLVAGELVRRPFAVAEHLANLRPGEEQVRLGVVGAGLAGGKTLTVVAPEGVLEHQRLDPELDDVDLLEDLLRVVGAVVVTGTGVIAADDEVQDRLARAGIVHLRRLHPQHHPILRVVLLHQHLVAAHPHVSGDIAGLGLADQRVDEEAVAGLQRSLGQVLVGAMDRVAGLESDDLLPAARLEVGLVLGRRLVAPHEGILVIWQRVDLDRAADTAAALLVNRGDPGVGLVGGAVDPLCLTLGIALPDLLDLDPPQRLAFVARQRDRVADLALEVGRQGDRDRPVVTVDGAHLGADALPVGGTLEAGQRREATVADHLEVRRVALVKGQGKLSHRLAHAGVSPIVRGVQGSEGMSEARVKAAS